MKEFCVITLTFSFFVVFVVAAAAAASVSWIIRF